MSYINFLDQTISEPKKDKAWHVKHALEYVKGNLNNDVRKAEILKLYKAYNAELTEKQIKAIKAITCPHGTYLGVEYVVYPLIQQKVEQIVGEYIQRPIRRKTYVLDKKSKNKKFEEKIKMLSEKIMRKIISDREKDLGFKPDTENPQMEIPEDIEAFFQNDFKTLAEQVADGVLNIFLDVRKEKNKLKEFFLDYTISDEAHGEIIKKDGFTSVRKISPLDCDYDLDPQKTVQDDHEYFFENYYLSENEIYNTFPELKQSERDEIRDLFKGFSQSDDGSVYVKDHSTLSKDYENWYSINGHIGKLRLVKVLWKSRKRVSIKVSLGKKDKEFYKKLDEDYEQRKKDTVEHIDGEMPRSVTMLGPNICLDWGVTKERYSSVDNPFQCKLPVVSIIRENTIGSSKIKSVAAKLYQLQDIASEILFEIRLALKSAGDSRVLLYDAAQTPKEFSKGGYENGINRVMTHIKKDKLLIYNSKQKGKSLNSKPFDSLDLSQKGGVQDLFNGLAIIEDLASKFVGISPERSGEIGQYQTATGTDRAIRGSMARTEILFTPFDEFVQALLEKVILSAKYHYEKGEVIHYIFGEMKSEFLMLIDDFFLSDYGLYLSDTRKDKEASERIDRAAEMSLSNANDPHMVMGLIEVLEESNASGKKAVFQNMLNTMDKMRQERAKAEQEALAAELQSKATDKEKDREVQYASQDKDRDVAQIYVKGKGLSDALKTTSSERIKAADIEQKNNAQK